MMRIEVREDEEEEEEKMRRNGNPVQVDRRPDGGEIFLCFPFSLFVISSFFSFYIFLCYFHFNFLLSFLFSFIIFIFP